MRTSFPFVLVDCSNTALEDALDDACKVERNEPHIGKCAALTALDAEGGAFIQARQTRSDALQTF